jgi:hypothetical protein
MLAQTVTLQVPETIYQRLWNTAQVIQRPLKEVMLHALLVGSPSAWDDVPPEFQADLAPMDRLSDAQLWAAARGQRPAAEVECFETLLARQQASALLEAEPQELAQLRFAFDQLMLRKARAVALLRWRGQSVTLP